MFTCRGKNCHKYINSLFFSLALVQRAATVNFVDIIVGVHSMDIWMYSIYTIVQFSCMLASQTVSPQKAEDFSRVLLLFCGDAVCCP